MKKQKLFSKCISIVLTLCLMMSMVTVGVSAANVDNNNNVTSSLSNDMEVQGTNSLGTMLASEIEAKSAEAEENNGCNVFEITVEGKQATATFETAMDASLMVGIYNEAGNTLIASGIVDVTNEDTEVTVDIDIEEMPLYFYLKGFLVDKESLKPICTAYNSPNYTQEMQEFFSKTTEDFEEDRILNLDSSIDNNFAVYNDDVIVLSDSKGNDVVSSDIESNTYIIENIDETVSLLQSGDIFAYTYGDDALIVKVDSISIDGTTATIVGAETDIDEVFDYIKFDAMAGEDDYTVDPSTCEEGITLVDDTNSKSGKVASGAAVDIEVNPKIKKSFSINCKYEDRKLGTRTVTGSLTFNSNCYIKVYRTLSYKYTELRLDYSAQISISTSASLAPEPLRLTEFIITPVAGLSVYLLPSFVFKMSGTLSISGSLKGTIGVSHSSDDGFKNLSSTPKFNAGINVAGSVFIGLNVEIGLGVLHKVIKMSLIGKLGADISSSGSDTIIKSKSKIHEGAALCVAGEINGKIGLDYSITFLNNDRLSLSGTVAEFSIKLFDFYYCAERDEFALTTCPRVKYLVNVSVVDRNGKPISGATVNNSHTTNANGVTSFYLPKGTHVITAIMDLKNKKKTVTITKSSISTTIKMNNIYEKPSGDSQEYSGNIAQISLGFHGLAVLMDDGTLYADGSYTGNGIAYSYKDKFTKINNNYGVLKEKSIKYVDFSSAGPTRAVITKDNSLYMWGDNSCGQIGDGTTESRSTPVKVLDNVSCVSIDTCRSAAVTTDGSLYMWGAHMLGQLYDGTVVATSSNKPVKIMDNVKSVDFSEWSYWGNSRGAIITTDNTLYMWGCLEYHHDSRILPCRCATESNSLVEVLHNVDSVKLGCEHSAAITTDGCLYMWGVNDCGQLGNGSKEDCLTPIKISDNIASVDLGWNHSVALTMNNSV